jgi:hypothetical protein
MRVAGFGARLAGTGAVGCTGAGSNGATVATLTADADTARCVSTGAVSGVTGRFTGGVGRCIREGSTDAAGRGGVGVRPPGNSRTIESRFATGGGVLGALCARDAVAENVNTISATAVTPPTRSTVILMESPSSYSYTVRNSWKSCWRCRCPPPLP